MNVELKLLEIRNKLNSIATYANECHDIHLSDLGTLQEIISDLDHNILKCRPPMNEDGNASVYDDYVLFDDPRAWFNEDAGYGRAYFEEKGNMPLRGI